MSRGGRAAFAARHEQDFARDVREGLLATPKRLPCRYFYDDAGSALFDAICDVPEYYIPAAEREILEERAGEIVSRMPAEADVVELGSGSAAKTRIVLDALLARQDRVRYVPIDISDAALAASEAALRLDYPALDVEPVLGEYEDGVAYLAAASSRPRLVLWLGSNIGNLGRAEAGAFLGRVARALGPADRVLAGIDLRKDAAMIERAYDDALGVTARFNKNVLARINRDLGGQFDLDRFRHRALYREREGRIEMYLISEDATRVRIDGLGLEVAFSPGEAIHTEDSHKYAPAEIDDLAAAAGLRIEGQWFDRRGLFSENLFAT